LFALIFCYPDIREITSCRLDCYAKELGEVELQTCEDCSKVPISFDPHHKRNPWLLLFLQAMLRLYFVFLSLSNREHLSGQDFTLIIHRELLVLFWIEFNDYSWRGNITTLASSQYNKVRAG
jgi:hypothetical protein